MFSQSPEERLTDWKSFRDSLELSNDPLLDVINFWKSAPYVPYNHHVDPFNQRSWPTPWEIIIHNKYDDFTKALMIAWSLKYTKRFGKSDIQVRSMVDITRNTPYNIVSVDNKWILNYLDTPVEAGSVIDNFRVENLVVMEEPK